MTSIRCFELVTQWWSPAGRARIPVRWAQVVHCRFGRAGSRRRWVGATGPKTTTACPRKVRGGPRSLPATEACRTDRTQVPATLELTHKAIGAEVRLAPYEVILDGGGLGAR